MIPSVLITGPRGQDDTEDAGTKLDVPCFPWQSASASPSWSPACPSSPSSTPPTSACSSPALSSVSTASSEDEDVELLPLCRPKLAPSAASPLAGELRASPAGTISRAAFLLGQLSLASRLSGLNHSFHPPSSTTHDQGGGAGPRPRLQVGLGLDGHISYTTGFLGPTDAQAPLPASLAPIEALHTALPTLLRNGTARRAIAALPALSAAWASLPQRHLARAAVVLSALAHAYFFGHRGDPTPLPDVVLLPWSAVCRRLGRPFTGRVVADDVLNNARPDVPDLSSSWFDLPEERLSNGLQGFMEARFAPALGLMAGAQSCVRAGDAEGVAARLEGLASVLVACATIFIEEVTPRATGQFDPVAWIKTYPAIGQPVLAGELGNSGLDAPLFHALDAFVGRDPVRGQGDLRGMQRDRREVFPGNVRAVIEALEQPWGQTVREFVGSCEGAAATRAKAAFDGVLQMYTWWLEMHRVKAVGITGVTLASGNHTTSSGVQSGQCCAQMEEAQADGPRLPPDAMLSRQMKAGIASRLGDRPVWQWATVLRRTSHGVACVVLELRMDAILPLEAGDRVQVYDDEDEDEDKRDARPRFYSLGDVRHAADGPGSTTITLTVRRGPGRVATFLADLQPGRVVRMRPWPCPRFRAPQDSAAPLVLVAQGTGAGPMLGFLRARARVQAAQAAPWGEMWLFLAAKRLEDMPCRPDELETLTAGLPSLTVMLALSGEKQHLRVTHGRVEAVSASPRASSGRVTTQHLAAHRDRVQQLVVQHGGHLYVCGSTAFGETVRRVLGHNQVPAGTRHSISPPPAHWRQWHEDLFGPSPASEKNVRGITPAELARHNTPASCWLALRGVVYDATDFLAQHPGGSKTLLEVAGTAADRRFFETHGGVHVQEVLGRLAPMAVGVLHEPAAGGCPVRPAAVARRVLDRLVRVQNALVNNTAFGAERAVVPFYVYRDALLVFARDGLDQVLGGLELDAVAAARGAQAHLDRVFARVRAEGGRVLGAPGGGGQGDLEAAEAAVRDLYRPYVDRVHECLDRCKGLIGASLQQEQERVVDGEEAYRGLLAGLTELGASLALIR